MSFFAPPTPLTKLLPDLGWARQLSAWSSGLSPNAAGLVLRCTLEGSLLSSGEALSASLADADRFPPRRLRRRGHEIYRACVGTYTRKRAHVWKICRPRTELLRCGLGRRGNEDRPLRY